MRGAHAAVALRARVRGRVGWPVHVVAARARGVLFARERCASIGMASFARADAGALRLVRLVARRACGMPVPSDGMRRGRVARRAGGSRCFFLRVRRVARRAHRRDPARVEAVCARRHGELPVRRRRFRVAARAGRIRAARRAVRIVAGRARDVRACMLVDLRRVRGHCVLRIACVAVDARRGTRARREGVAREARGLGLCGRPVRLLRFAPVASRARCVDRLLVEPARMTLRACDLLRADVDDVHRRAPRELPRLRHLLGRNDRRRALLHREGEADGDRDGGGEHEEDEELRTAARHDAWQCLHGSSRTLSSALVNPRP